MQRERAQPNVAPLSDLGDAELVARAKQGDVQAFGFLYRRHVDAIYDFAVNRLGQRGDAEDVTQTVFLRVAQSIHTCREGAAFRGWLFAIARNAVADERRQVRFPAATLADGFEIEDPEPSLEERAIRADQRDELRRARARCLSESERELYDLLVQDLTYAEMAAALGRRINAIRTRYWRLLEKLRACLGLVATNEGARHVAR